MQTIKRRYVDVMQGLGGRLPLSTARGAQTASAEAAFGWQRWFASLFAIYDTDAMIRLDLPWWNVAATREIDLFLAGRPDARVFEYGSGASTIWLAKRCREILSVEHDRSWHDRFQQQAAGRGNITLLHRPILSESATYAGSIDEFDGQFDLIVVDGRHRAKCLERTVDRLKPGGVIVFDDSGRARYRRAIGDCGLVERRHFGRSFCVPYPDYTSLLRHDGR